MSSLELHVVPVDPNDPLFGLGDLLANIEKDISSSDLRSIEHRHKSGKWMLTFRVDTKGGKRLPQRTRQALVDLLDISKAEIANRMKLAEKYQVTELSNLLDNSLTWHGICKNALYDKRPAPEKVPRTISPVARSARSFTRELRTTPTLTVADYRALRALLEAITTLLAGSPS